MCGNQIKGLKILHGDGASRALTSGTSARSQQEPGHQIPAAGGRHRAWGQQAGLCFWGSPPCPAESLCQRHGALSTCGRACYLPQEGTPLPGWVNAHCHWGMAGNGPLQSHGSFTERGNTSVDLFGLRRC